MVSGLNARKGEAGGARAGSAAASPAIGAAAGAIGGLLASWLMVQFQHRVWPAPPGDGGEPSTSKLARLVTGIAGMGPLTDGQAKLGGELVHYGLGTGLGLLYGAAATRRPAVSAGAGLAFGVATEIAIDQALVPALGLSNPFWKCPAAWHARGLAAHLVFGSVTEVTRRAAVGLADAVRAAS